MSDTETAAAPEVTPAPAAETAPVRERKPKDKAIFATLVRGANYAIRHKGKIYRFKGGAEVGPIPASLKDHLEETATDGLTITDGENVASTEQRSKFTFTEK